MINLFNEETLSEYLDKKKQKQFSSLFVYNTDVINKPDFDSEKVIREAANKETLKLLVINFNDISKELSMEDSPSRPNEKVACVTYTIKHNSDPILFSLKPEQHDCNICEADVKRDSISFTYVTECHDKLLSDDLILKIKDFKEDVIESIKKASEALNIEIKAYNDTLYSKATEVFAERKNLANKEKDILGKL